MWVRGKSCRLLPKEKKAVVLRSPDEIELVGRQVCTRNRRLAVKGSGQTASADGLLDVMGFDHARDTKLSVHASVPSVYVSSI